MPMDQKDIENTMSKAILDALEKDATLWAVDIEQKYPKWKGSRFLTRDQDKLTFGFKNDHAAQLEDGSPAMPVTGTYVQKVKSHQRKGTGKSKRGKTHVDSHKRTYKNHKPIQLPSGEWRMVSIIPQVKATKPISTSVTKRYTGKEMEKLIADAIKQAFN